MVLQYHKCLTNVNTEHEDDNQHLMLHPSALRTVLNNFSNYLTEIHLYLALDVIKHALKYLNVYRLYYTSSVI